MNEQELFEYKCRINLEVQNRFDELMAIGEHGVYETIFQIVHEHLEKQATRIKELEAELSLYTDWEKD